MPIKENQVKPAVDSKDREADKFPLKKGPTAFSSPKRARLPYPLPARASAAPTMGWAVAGAGLWAHYPAGRPTIPHPPLPASFPEGTSRVVGMLALTARSKTSKDSKDLKQVKRLQPEEEILPVSILWKQNTLKLPKLCGVRDATGRDTKLLEGLHWHFLRLQTCRNHHGSFPACPTVGLFSLETIITCA